MRLLMRLAGLGIVLVLVCARYEQQQWTTPVAVNALYVTPGMTARQVSQALHPTWPAWRHALAFRVFPQLGTPQVGRYQWSPQMGYLAVLEKIGAGEAIPSRTTLIEGTTIQEAWARVIAHPDVVSTGAPEWRRWLSDWGSPFSHPEGVLLAETFFWHGEVAAEALLRRAHDALLDELNAAWSSASERTKAVLKTPYEALILASIVEKETGLSAERGLIAGVFLSRLEQGMRLQTDPTVIYGLGAQFDGNLTRKNLREKTPYNTYRIDGLPPTPIALVGRASLEAVMHPKATSALYFVSKGDGSHAFSETLDEHNRNVRRYQLGQTE